MTTFHELIEKLKKEDEVFLLEMLGIYSEDLIERFHDKVEKHFDKLAELYSDETEQKEFTGTLEWEDGHKYRTIEDWENE